jgi:FkbM family methyltransferase
MFDGSDSRYFLDEGHRVVAVEANPELAGKARQEFQDDIAGGRLTVLNFALADEPGEIELVLCGDDLGASSIFGDKIAHRKPFGTLTVPTITFAQLVGQFGVPDYVKVDIEGADRHCILAMGRDNRPRYLSFEADHDLEELMAHMASIGYRQFKLIGQCSFLELGNERSLGHRSRRKLMRWLGFDQPLSVRRAGRWFRLMHSSGPAPWVSDGNWYSAAILLSKWNHARRHNQLSGWYDVHAC